MICAEPRRISRRRELGGGVADPARQGRAVDVDALARQHLRLPIERQVPGVLPDQDMRHHRLGRQSALDQPLRRRGLDDRALAGAARVFRPAGEDDPVLRRDDVEPLGRLLADDMHRAMTARTGGVLGRDDDLDARQMRRELGTPQLVQQMTQLVVLLDQTIALGDGAADQRAQRFDIVGKGIGQRAHKAYRITSLVSLSAAICTASRYAAIPSGESRADAHCTAFGRMIRGTCTRDQSSPSSEGLQEYPWW